MEHHTGVFAKKAIIAANVLNDNFVSHGDMTTHGIGAASGNTSNGNAVHAASCGNVPDGLHGSFHAGSVPGGHAETGAFSYGSDHLSVLGGAGNSHTSGSGFSSNSISYDGKVYVCPSGSTGPTYNASMSGYHNNYNSNGFRFGIGAGF